MSKKRNRAKLNKAQTSREYKAIQYDILYPLYWDEGIVFYGRLMAHERRACKNWKHNRKKQYKIK